MSGEIESGADLARINFVFCSPTEALHMVGNKYIHIQVTLPPSALLKNRNNTPTSCKYA